MLVGTLFFSVMSVFAKLASQRLPTMELVLARVLVTLVMSWWVIRRLGIYPWGNNKKLLLLRGFAGFMGLSCYFYAIAHLPLADATVIQFCNPMLAALIAVFALKEQLRMLDVIATICSRFSTSSGRGPKRSIISAAKASTSALSTSPAMRR